MAVPWHRDPYGVAQMAEQDAEFTRFVEGCRPALRRAAFRLTSDWYEADDLVQRTLIALYRRWASLERRDRLAAYAHRTMVHLVISDRRTRRWSSEILLARLPEPEPVPDAWAVVADRLVLLDVLAGLGPRQRAAVVMRYCEDRRIDEIAALLGCMSSTVRSQLARALTTLRSALTADGAAARKMRTARRDPDHETPGIALHTTRTVRYAHAAGRQNADTGSLRGHDRPG
jgi:RNA polymerase sigma-70 factor (sigma-E family)